MSLALEIEGIDEFIAELENWVGECRVLASQVARGIAAYGFTFVLDHSAQFSGDFAANWNLSVGAPNFAFEDNALHHRADHVTDRIMGDPEAIEHAKAKSQGILDRALVGDDLYVSNGATHEEPYAWLIENNFIKFRPGNAGQPIGLFVQVFGSIYGGSELTSDQAHSLAQHWQRL